MMNDAIRLLIKLKLGDHTKGNTFPEAFDVESLITKI